MKYDLFLSLCQTEVAGHLPSEREMFGHFFDQVCYADQLGYGTAWVAEAHLSCEVQKSHRRPVIPQFVGEIGLNTDIFQLGHIVYQKTKQIQVGSAICNLLCNGGPIARAEAVKTFLTLHNLDPAESRVFEFGFAGGRFPFSNEAYGFAPRNEAEQAHWPLLQGKFFAQATEIFLRLLNGEALASHEVTPMILELSDFKDEPAFGLARATFRSAGQTTTMDTIGPLPSFWNFEKVGVIPKEYPDKLLRLTIGSHDPKLQIAANQFRPVGVFNLSITPPKVIEETHQRMARHYKGKWLREFMPRTSMVFIDATAGFSEEARYQKAYQLAAGAWSNYWKAMEGTIDPQKIEAAVSNALVGSPKQIAQQIREKYHPQDRLMLWFDFNLHDNDLIKKMMRLFIEEVTPLLEERS